MEQAINQIKQLIKFYENESKAHQEFLNRRRASDSSKEFAKRAYDDLINELYQAIAIIENAVA